MGRNFMKHIKPFSPDRRLQIRKAGRVSAGVRQARDEALTDGVDDGGEHDRDCAGCLLSSPQGDGGIGENYVGRQFHQISDSGGCPLVVERSIAIVDLQISSDVPAELF